MSCTIKKLANISNVSVRTLRFYDEIGLLKPAFYGLNNYRYYEAEQILKLQQILFYKEMDFSLKNIQLIFEDKKFDKVKALNAHREYLELQIKRQSRLIKTIDNTIAKLNGDNKIMNNKTLFDGFDIRKQNEYEEYLIQKGNHDVLLDAKERTKNWNDTKFKEIKEDMDHICQNLTECIRANSKVSDPEVQNLIEKHYQFIKNFWEPTYETYIELSKLYLDHSDYRKFYDQYDPKLLNYKVEAIKYYAANRLK